MRVGLDFGAGTQSARPLMEQCEFLYMPIDIKRWMYLAHLGEWMENVVLDLSKGTGEPEDMNCGAASDKQYWSSGGWH